ncbi:hypothetical protein R1flu_011426 [Riccia fluitans]|uniref:Reverse transcriptase Ty1/copia-type domain-containing protein n=1 Tax=Riccia fluitans TaxID=41844 RepID=A0ABD1Z8Y9_9MARC
MWVYKRKEGSGADKKIFKAKLVAKGFTQWKGVDYSEVFTPIAKYLTIWLLLSLVLLYVDNMLIAAKDKSEVEKIKIQLSVEFSMKDLDPAKCILGMEIQRDVKGGRLWLTQGNYAKKVLERFNMLDAKPVGTPWRITSSINSQQSFVL